jgi:xylulokinase
MRAVERNWALEAGFIDLRDDRIADDLVALGGLPRSAVPDAVAPHHRLGAVTKDAAQKTGLPEGLIVFGGAADHIASALAAGLTRAGDVLLKFGGAGDVIAVTERAAPDRRLFLDYHLIPGLFAPNGCMASSGSALRWLAGLIGGDGSDETLAKLDAAAEKIAPGSEGVRALPYFLGEKTPIHDPSARGTITGLSLGHGAGHIWRAALEAVACGFRHHLDVLVDMGQPVEKLLASDGGSRSAIWMRIVADVCGRPVRRLADSHGSAVGAGWVAIVGLGLGQWSDIAGASAKGDIFVPDRDATSVYDRVYTEYRALYETLKPFFSRTFGP